MPTSSVLVKLTKNVCKSRYSMSKDPNICSPLELQEKNSMNLSSKRLPTWCTNATQTSRHFHLLDWNAWSDLKWPNLISHKNWKTFFWFSRGKNMPNTYIYIHLKSIHLCVYINIEKLFIIPIAQLVLYRARYPGHIGRITLPKQKTITLILANHGSQLFKFWFMIQPFHKFCIKSPFTSTPCPSCHAFLRQGHLSQLLLLSSLMWFIRLGTVVTKSILRTSSTFALFKVTCWIVNPSQFKKLHKTWRIFWQLSDGSSINCFQFLPCEYIMLHLESNNQGFFLKELCPQTHAIGTLKPFTCRMIQWFHTVKSWKLLFKRRGFRECQKVGRYYGMTGSCPGLTSYT